MDSDESQLKLFGIGVVAFDKPVGTDIIQVYPTEHLTFEEGDVPNKKEDMETEVVDISGVPFKGKVVRKAIMTAKWFPDGDDGRQTAPDVVSGETVKIYRYGDSIEYFWKTIFREPKLRRLEHVVFAFCDLKSGREQFELDSSYGICFSTKKKFLNFWTSMSDGEKFKYEFKFDTKAGTFEVFDNIGNKFGFNSADEDIYMENASGTVLRAVKNKVEINVAETITMNVPVANISGELNVTKLVVGGVDVTEAVKAL